MAIYKVPQDVEADDKLIGPFNFRQFIYLIIVTLAIAGAWGLAQLFLPLMIIPVPIIVFFGALALPLRKDQPMEVFMAAIVSFYLKPRKRLWDPDGIDSLIEIVAPKTDDIQLIKELSQDETRRRLSYLADVVDSQGWAVRGVNAPVTNNALNDDIIIETEQVDDVMDNNDEIAQSFDYKLNQSDARRHQDMIKLVNHQRAYAPEPTIQIPVSIPIDNPIEATIQTAPNFKPLASPTFNEPHLKFNPYPNDIQQSVIQPLTSNNYPNQPTNISDNFIKKRESTSTDIPTADIINLANNADLSIETIAREANRIKKSKTADQEVVISLR